MKTVISMLGTVLLALGLTVAASAATFVVNTTNDTVDAAPGDGTCSDGANCSLRAAISEANALAGDDIITLPAGTYTHSLVAANDDLNAGGDYDITGNLVINGAGSGTTIVQANAAVATATERVFNIRSGTVTLAGMTIRHGRFTGVMAANTRGGGIENLGSLTLNDAIVTLNQVSSTSGNPIGGGLHNAGPAVTLINSSITQNLCTRPTSTGSAFGGGMDSIVAATLVFTNSNITNNTASSPTGFGFGPGLYLENIFNVTATNSHFDNNIGTGSSGSNGGGVRALSATGAAVFNATNCTFNNNVGTPGGTSLHQGVGLQLFTVTSAAATLTGTFTNSTISGNSGNSGGVGVNATVNGGALTLNFINSTLSGNTGAGTASNGGGILVSNAGSTLGASSTATVNFTNSTVSNNTVSANGGGIAMEQPTAGVITMNLNYTTVSNNAANSDATGTESGGGIIRLTGTMNIKNSIVANNSIGGAGTAPDISGAVVSGDYNHFENITGATISGTTTNNVTGTDPDIGALGPNGGPTLTHLPNASSPVLNTIPNGTNDCGTTVTTDQRGLPRPSGGACDKGSTERAGLAPGPWNLSGFIKDDGGRPIRNVSVVLTGGPSPQTVVTGMLGEYGFAALPGGSYTVSISSKRFTFTPPSQVVSLGADTTNVNFTADPGFGVRPAPEGVLIGDRMLDGVLIGDRGTFLREGVLVGDRAPGDPDPAETVDGVLVGDRAGKDGVLVGDRMADGILVGDRKKP